MLVVPGLLQTEEYAQALMGVYELGADKAERFVSSRGVRQQLLDRPDPPTLFAGDSFLSLPAGGTARERDPYSQRVSIVFPSGFVRDFSDDTATTRRSA